MLEDRLLLIRHGESTWNAERRLAGQADPPLTEGGRRQAAALAPAVGGFPPERAVVSDLVRARETAALLGHPGARVDARWREFAVGEWEGRPWRELPPGTEPAWRGGPLVPPGGESWEEATARVAGALEELRAAGGSWLVVSHGAAIRATVCVLTGIDARRITGPANASLSVLRLSGPSPQLLTYGWTPNGSVFAP
ncbi:MAG TPA: histidine phosphatase family protein [Solirubrobacteraceae bacterium]|jgi:probable phosphoglycerate mutase